MLAWQALPWRSQSRRRERERHVTAMPLRLQQAT